MSDEEEKRKTEIVTGVAAEVVKALPIRDLYQDAIQPAASETGLALAETMSFVNAALRPFKSLTFAWNSLFDRLDGWLAHKLKEVDPAQIIEPKPNIAGTLLTGLVFMQEEPALRELYVCLLATAMTRDKAEKVHPAFAECHSCPK